MISILESFYNENLLEVLSKDQISMVTKRGSLPAGYGRPTGSLSVNRTAHSIPQAVKTGPSQKTIDATNKLKAQWTSGATINRVQ